MAQKKEDRPRTTFMDLPTEIRMEIYGYVLIETLPIEICAYHQKKDQRKAPHPSAIGLKVIRDRNWGSRMRKENRGQIYDWSARVWILAPPLRTAILHANKQIHSEATQVLMGKNRFNFRNTKALDKCLDVLGPQAQHLRFVSISGKGYIKKYAKPAFDKLAKTAKFLKTLRVDHIELCRGENGNGIKLAKAVLLRDCLGPLQSLHQSHEEQGITFNVLDVIDCHLQDYCSSPDHRYPGGKHTRWMEAATEMRREPCGCDCAQADQNHAEIREELRQMVSKALGIERKDSGEDED